MLTVKDDQFMLNGQPFQILSGSIHYFRVPQEYWEDRLIKLKNCGFNTVETYIPWNFHEPKKGQFHFEGMADIEQFIATAESLGLYIILRPAPYICAEWEFGGLPAWLLKDRNMALRCADPNFLKHIEDYYDVLLPKLVPHLITNGGNVFALQIENEYGAYGNDKQYLERTREIYKEKGIDVLLFTSDGPDMIEDGSLPDVLTTLNFGSRVEDSYAMLDAYKPDSPKLCAEFWIGWFDSWGKEHHTRDPKDAAATLRVMLEKGGSVNFYMFHGGTNFAFYNGANQYETYDPTITSYDYDSLLTESGEITEKYKEVQKVLKEFGTIPEPVEPPNIPILPEQKVQLDRSVSLFDTLTTIANYHKHVVPMSMEEMDQAYGYVLYRTTIDRKADMEMDTSMIRDRAFLYINGEYVQTVYRNDEKKEITLSFPEEINTLEIFVENMGRVNYGKHLRDRKGIIENLWIDNQYMFHWEMFSIELEEVVLDFSRATTERFPQFYEGTFELAETGDTFLNMEGWKKGNVFINGFNLGRYWEIGPQKTLYLPAPFLNVGENTIQILELEGTKQQEVLFANKPDLG
ncbi:glycoside hydrolase family 35 protein [Oceanobacillus jordanicus]|uniref:Beta-galactosidase n=1 Tax=Oceanobacillus jordanicus TaxID=2867266 RepID=A0AAW5AYZ7_9BACI|nr:beta-galactosidase [Oceanobacillus jordanicus]MCG3418120.1 beta-galactosidase [Oceanobacillus jordanicus]